MDLAIFQFLFGLTGKFFILDTVVVIVAKYIPYFVILGMAILILREAGWRKQLFLAIFTVLTIVVGWGIISTSTQFFYLSERPFVELGLTPLINSEGPSFPSGHATLLFGLAFTCLFFHKKWGIWFLILASVNGVARILAGVHWPSDILGGVAVAFVGAGIAYLLLRRLFGTVRVDPAHQ